MRCNRWWLGTPDNPQGWCLGDGIADEVEGQEHICGLLEGHDGDCACVECGETIPQSQTKEQEFITMGAPRMDSLPTPVENAETGRIFSSLLMLVLAHKGTVCIDDAAVDAMENVELRLVIVRDGEAKTTTLIVETPNSGILLPPLAIRKDMRERDHVIVVAPSRLVLPS